MWDNEHKNTTIVAIGTVESNRTYDSINFNDPITVGVVQWFGTRASDILVKMKNAHASEYSSVASSLRNDLDNRPVNDSFWNTRYLTRIEGNSLKPLLSVSRDIQDQQIITDIEGYASTAQSFGFDINNNTDSFILWASAYHQSPRSALQVLSLVGVQANLDTMLSGLLNHSVLGRYSNRYNRVYQIIKDKITDSTINTEPSQNGGDIKPNEISGNMRYVRKDGDGCLRIHTSEGVVTAYPTGLNYWIIGVKNGGTVGSSQTTPDIPPPADSGKAGEVVQWVQARKGQFAYSQAPGRLDPDKNGYTDCSGLIWRAYQDVAGINVGTWTGQQKNMGREIVRGSGRMSDSDVAKLKPGDLVVMQWNAGYGHVELVVSGNTHIGHGGPGNGPVEHNNLSSYLTNTSWWTVRRHIDV